MQNRPNVSSQSSGLCPIRLQNVDDLIARYVAQGILPGAVTLVARHGKIAYLKAQGWSDIENRVPMREDSLFRIYSLSKIVTTVAVLTLYEKGLLDLNDPVYKFLPGFANRQVRQADGSLVPARRDITIYDLLRHCAGLLQPPALEVLQQNGDTLESIAARWASEPLVAQPGEKWIYGISTDLLARMVEVISGQSYDEFLRQALFVPLGLNDTGFFVPDEKADRLCVCYRHSKEGKLTVQDGNGSDSPFRSPPKLCSGGGGLVTSTADYLRFATMLLNGGQVDDVRILGRKTVEFMTMDHLPNEHPNLSIGTQCFRFGLGVSVVTNVPQSRCLSSLGDFGWGGAAGTQVWINPEEKMITMIMIQVRAEVPTGIMDIYKRLVYQALVD